ncbi:DegT/DnrJ/EryC1/StrS family aminotransferase [Pseudomonadales bacterium]|nr:DegT/DnrJ/EryC1/StrS family aminotransferase [Pseudomonadales bacterium]
MIYLSPPHMSGNEKKYIDQAFASNWIAPVGPNLDALEIEFSVKLGVKSAAAVSSGTAALHLALRVLGVEEGDVVFCSAFTFIASVTPILYQKASPVLIDSEALSWNMSPIALERALKEAQGIGKLPKAIIVVGLYGQSADMDPLLALADSYGIPIIEDAAESLGAKYKCVQSGTLGKLGIFSFNGNKIITGSGGGMLVSNDETLIAKAKKLSTQAREPAAHYEHLELGYNYRMSNIIAGICRGQLEVLDDRVEAKRKIFKKYKDMLSNVDAIHWMPEPDWSRSSRWLSCFRIQSQDYFDPRQLISFLSTKMIEARPLWKPMHLQPLLAGTKFYSESTGVTEKSVSEVLYDGGVCLPSGSNMTDADIERVVSSIKRFFEKASGPC